ncbi:uncharacterized protein LOC106008049 isoform X2 [Heterocephalus glaber]|uniref:Uncharacterized protein LOC106008049 isoform X2 n=1 Tax=Heterocephalus glaber TaxID=10181 RepID=A0AAX6S029_HETGA|nr:uncharacterized protein LOC106008049 isoform X2 [Heterocephalus glaber]
MGGTCSTGSITLDCVLTNFKLAFSPEQADEYGVKFSRRKLHSLCQLEWPAFGVGWPAKGTFDPSVCWEIWGKVTGRPGHPDQFPYINIWVQAYEKPSAWLQRCSLRTDTCILVAAPKEPWELKPRAPKPVLSQEPDPLNPLGGPLPYVDSSTPSDGSHSRPHNPSLPPSAQPSAPTPLYPPLPEGPQSPDSVTSPPHTRAGAAYGPCKVPTGEISSAPLLPLRETEQGHYVYIPFTTSDLYNWKHQNPPFSEKPQALISLLESIFHTHDPTWGDCQQLLQALFTSEERERIQGQAVRLVLGGPEGAQLPSTQPRWQTNTSGGREALQNYRQHLLAGLRGAAWKPTNLSKMTS